MPIETAKYVRNPIFVDAVQVTKENFEDVAVWCQGDICNRDGTLIGTSSAGEDGEHPSLVIDPSRQYIVVRVHAPRNSRQTMAYVGDWVLSTERGFKVFTPTAFESSWTKVE